MVQKYILDVVWIFLIYYSIIITKKILIMNLFLTNYN